MHTCGQYDKTRVLVAKVVAVVEEAVVVVVVFNKRISEFCTYTTTLEEKYPDNDTTLS